MQKIDRENGCLFVQPGSHKGDLHLHTYPTDGIVNKAYHGIHNLSEADTTNMLHVEMEAGDTLFFHPLLIHGSGRNLSNRYRKAISCHYAATECVYGEMKGTMQQEIAAEIEQMARKRGGQMQFNDIWRAKSRLIQVRFRIRANSAAAAFRAYPITGVLLRAAVLSRSHSSHRAHPGFSLSLCVPVALRIGWVQGKEGTL